MYDIVGICVLKQYIPTNKTREKCSWLILKQFAFLRKVRLHINLKFLVIAHCKIHPPTKYIVLQTFNNFICPKKETKENENRLKFKCRINNQFSTQIESDFNFMHSKIQYFQLRSQFQAFEMKMHKIATIQVENVWLSQLEWLGHFSWSMSAWMWLSRTKWTFHN